MNIKLFGPRCFVEFYRPKSQSRIVIPDIAQNGDSHRMGIVRFIGDGRVKNKDVPEPSLVKEGDIVLFQLNGVMETTQKFVLEGKHYMNLLQSELIARIDGDLSEDNLTMLGDYVLLKHFTREQPGSKLVVPESVAKSLPEFIYFRCLKKGSTVDLPIKVGDEIVANLGRLTPLFIVSQKLNGSVDNQEFCYTRKEWIDGTVEA